MLSSNITFQYTSPQDRKGLPITYAHRCSLLHGSRLKDSPSVCFTPVHLPGVVEVAEVDRKGGGGGLKRWWRWIEKMGDEGCGGGTERWWRWLGKVVEEAWRGGGGGLARWRRSLRKVVEEAWKGGGGGSERWWRWLGHRGHVSTVTLGLGHLSTPYFTAYYSNLSHWSARLLKL